MSTSSTSEPIRPSAPGSGSISVVSAESNSLYAGVARSAIRGLALYFSRPVRLFRPTKARHVPLTFSPCYLLIEFFCLVAGLH